MMKLRKSIGRKYIIYYTKYQEFMYTTNKIIQPYSYIYTNGINFLVLQL